MDTTSLHITKTGDFHTAAPSFYKTRFLNLNVSGSTVAFGGRDINLQEKIADLHMRFSRGTRMLSHWMRRRRGLIAIYAIGLAVVLLQLRSIL